MDSAIIETIAQLGFPAAMAAFFVWWTTTQVSKRIDDLGLKIEKNTQTVAFLAITLARTNGLDPEELRKFVDGE